jgi:hypothetical protein
MDAKKLISTPPSRLDGFRDYDDFVDYAGSLFDLTEEEFEGLYRVLLKLQGIGENPVETMALWKEDTCRGGCPEFIRFMIQVEQLDLAQLKAVA